MQFLGSVDGKLNSNLEWPYGHVHETSTLDVITAAEKMQRRNWLELTSQNMLRQQAIACQEFLKGQLLKVLVNDLYWV